jgi:hypothetical protein
MPQAVAEAVAELGTWFVIGEHAVRCLCPYRPSRDVDCGVGLPRDLDALVAELGRRGKVDVIERSDDTVHLIYQGINVSIFVLPSLVPFTEQRRLSTTGILATKLHAILDRGMRRDFFDLYITLQTERLGIAECLLAMRRVHGPDLNDGLLLRSLTFFDDAEREALLPGEGPNDWLVLRDFFLSRVGELLVPPMKKLAIQNQIVDVTRRVTRD